MARVRTHKFHRHVPTLCVIVAAQAAGAVLMVAGPGAPPLGPWLSLNLLLGILFVGYIPFRCQHLGWCMIFGVVLGCTGMAIPLLWTTIPLMGSRVLTIRPAIALAFLIAAGGVIGGSALMFWRAVLRLLILRLNDPDGTTCPFCGYCILHLQGTICPECGTDCSSHVAASHSVSTGRNTGAWRRRLVATTALAALAATALLMLPPVRSGHWRALAMPWYWDYALCEAHDRRGAAFYALVFRLNSEARMLGRAITPDQFRSVVGPPDLFLTDGTNTFYIYRFGPNQQVAYVDFMGGQLTVIGYNIEGVNDHSQWRPFPTSEPIGRAT